MKLWIQTQALSGKSDELLWSGALHGIKYMQRLHHHCSFNVAELSKQQQNLLHNEEISSESFNRDDADFTVNASEGKLALQAEEAETQIFNNWIELSNAVCFPRRTAAHKRQTAETNITIELNLDGTGQNDIDTGLNFLNHMLEQISKHGLIDLVLRCDGDLEVDEHHTIEDVAIALGTAVKEALGYKTGINRYGFALPMDESQSTVLLDLSGRPYLVFEGDFKREMVGDIPTEMVEHFFYSLAMNLQATLHISIEGKNDHHKIEACFKSFARCLRAAVSRNERNLNILPSTKNLL